MSKHELYKGAFSRIVQAEQVRHDARMGRAPQWNPTSEARRRLEQAGEKVTAYTLASFEEYLEETGE